MGWRESDTSRYGHSPAHTPNCAGGCNFEGGEPYLEGDDPPELANGGIAVQRRVVRAGVATVELTVNATTEEQCFYLDPESRCLSYFQQVNITGSSGEQSIVLGEASPAPTATPRSTPLGHDGDDGCSVAPPGAADTLPLLPLVAPALLLQLARRRRADLSARISAGARAGEQPVA